METPQTHIAKTSETVVMPSLLNGMPAAPIPKG
jgi:hypothetical protein